VKRLSVEERSIATRLKASGQSTRQCARHLKCSPNTIRRWWSRWLQNGNVDTYYTGGSRKTPPELRRQIIRWVLAVQGRTAREAAVHFSNARRTISRTTVCRILKAEED
jgi:transposase